MLLAALVLAAAAPAPKATATPNPVVEIPLKRVVVAFPTPDEAVVTLHGDGRELAVPELGSQRLKLGDVDVPLPAAPDVKVTPGGSSATFKVVLKTVPEGVLALDPYATRVRWEALGAKGKPVLAVRGTVNMADKNQVELPTDDLTSHYARLDDYTATPSGLTVGVRLLLSLYNPFAFEVVATGLEYRLEVGGNEVIAAQRPGFRLRPEQRSDVLVEQDVPLADLASSLASLLARKPATFSGVLKLQTPKGERHIPAVLHAGS